MRISLYTAVILAASLASPVAVHAASPQAYRDSVTNNMLLQINAAKTTPPIQKQQPISDHNETNEVESAPAGMETALAIEPNSLPADQVRLLELAKQNSAKIHIAMATIDKDKTTIAVASIPTPTIIAHTKKTAPIAKPVTIAKVAIPVPKPAAPVTASLKKKPKTTPIVVSSAIMPKVTTKSIAVKTEIALAEPMKKSSPVPKPTVIHAAIPVPVRKPEEPTVALLPTPLSLAQEIASFSSNRKEEILPFKEYIRVGQSIHILSSNNTKKTGHRHGKEVAKSARKTSNPVIAKHVPSKPKAKETTLAKAPVPAPRPVTIAEEKRTALKPAAKHNDVIQAAQASSKTTPLTVPFTETKRYTLQPAITAPVVSQLGAKDSVATAESFNPLYARRRPSQQPHHNFAAAQKPAAVKGLAVDASWSKVGNSVDTSTNPVAEADIAPAAVVEEYIPASAHITHRPKDASPSSKKEILPWLWKNPDEQAKNNIPTIIPAKPLIQEGTASVWNNGKMGLIATPTLPAYEENPLGYFIPQEYGMGGKLVKDSSIALKEGKMIPDNPTNGFLGKTLRTVNNNTGLSLHYSKEEEPSSAIIRRETFTDSSGQTRTIPENVMGRQVHSLNLTATHTLAPGLQIKGYSGYSAGTDNTISPLLGTGLSYDLSDKFSVELQAKTGLSTGYGNKTEEKLGFGVKYKF